MNLDIFWLKDKELGGVGGSAGAGWWAQEIADDLQAAVEQFAAVAAQIRDEGEATVIPSVRPVSCSNIYKWTALRSVLRTPRS